MTISSSSAAASSSSNIADGMKSKIAHGPPPKSRWRSEGKQRIYGRRLLDALRAARRGDGSSNTVSVGPRVIKDASDSALALTAQGQTRWSSAILFGRIGRRKLLLKAGGKIRRRMPWRKTEVVPPKVVKGKMVRDRLRILSRLVPGCRKLSAPMLLEETADYVAALEMQVRTMRMLSEALSAGMLPTAMEGSPSSDAAIGE
ncbi:hypothetical protein HPP92_027383 [Vanilla planifolia]|uniref:Uncharacterized protein n=1 Tax=Vanilla planifolia TaxID=51239 RepID=A0A835PBV2_VANPL|nr:hypothetical protein HPP92_027383 [Vanilla planifolia]KAG0449353.1 hypothetical protein HPP92_027393 [Vanilla planifolia]